MNEFQLQCIPTHDLSILRRQIDIELQRRQRPKAVAARLNKISGKSISDPGAKKILNKDIQLANSSDLLVPPGIARKKYGALRPYLKSLINQDWSHIFNGGDERLNYYVYAHVDPRKKNLSLDPEFGGAYGGQPFYIGKGCGDRAFDLKRNQGHGKVIKAILDDGYPPESIVKIIFSDIYEAKAFELESKLVMFFGTIYQPDRKQGILYNLDIPSLPEFKGVMEQLITAPITCMMKDGSSKPVKGQRNLPAIHPSLIP